MIKLSIVIPDWKDPYSMDTIRDILKNSELGDALEVIEVFDGHIPEFKLVEDPRVRYVYLGANRGMRGAINAGIAVATGEFFMRLDEHCSFGKGFDKILTDSCKENEVMTARRYYLDPVKWEVMKDKGYVDYEDLTIQNVSETTQKFAGKPNREKLKARKDIMIDETMAMQGSCWIMKRAWWDKVIGELQSEGYGTHYGDSHEMVFKTWKAGGKLMVNKFTWHAHKHRTFQRTHNYGTKEALPGWTYSLSIWRDYYEKVTIPAWKI